jgi:hypothetical protein
MWARLYPCVGLAKVATLIDGVKPFQVSTASRIRQLQCTSHRVYDLVDIRKGFDEVKIEKAESGVVVWEVPTCDQDRRHTRIDGIELTDDHIPRLPWKTQIHQNDIISVPPKSRQCARAVLRCVYFVNVSQQADERCPNILVVVHDEHATGLTTSSFSPRT